MNKFEQTVGLQELNGDATVERTKVRLYSVLLLNFSGLIKPGRTQVR